MLKTVFFSQNQINMTSMKTEIFFLENFSLFQDVLVPFSISGYSCLIYKVNEWINLMIESNTNSLAPEKQENSDIIPTLHELYTITTTPQGRQTVIQVVSMDTNLETLLQLVEKKGKLT